LKDIEKRMLRYIKNKKLLKKNNKKNNWLIKNRLKKELKLQI
jgi:hypothetical protein